MCMWSTTLCKNSLQVSEKLKPMLSCAMIMQRYKSPKADVLQVSSNILGLARFLFSEVYADMYMAAQKALGF